MNLKFYLRTGRVYVNYKLKKYVPFSIYLSLTYKCVLKCTHCFIHKQNVKGELTTYQLYNIIDDINKLKVPYINFWGGEPLLRPDLTKLGEYAKQKGIISSVTTNGNLITKRMAEQLVRSFDIIKVSFKGLEYAHDNTTKIKGSYKRTEKGLINLLKVKPEGVQIIINLVVNQQNSAEIKKFVELYHDKADLISFLPEHVGTKVYSNPRFIKDWIYLSKKFNIGDSEIFTSNLRFTTDYCDAGKLYCSIYPNGTVYACDVRRECVLGNVNNQRFYDIWKNKNAEIEKKISECPGCYMKSTVEVSQIFRMHPLQILMKTPMLIKRYKLKGIK